MAMLPLPPSPSTIRSTACTMRRCASHARLPPTYASLRLIEEHPRCGQMLLVWQIPRCRPVDFTQLLNHGVANREMPCEDLSTIDGLLLRAAIDRGYALGPGLSQQHPHALSATTRKRPPWHRDCWIDDHIRMCDEVHQSGRVSSAHHPSAPRVCLVRYSARHCQDPA